MLQQTSLHLKIYENIKILIRAWVRDKIVCSQKKALKVCSIGKGHHKTNSDLSFGAKKQFKKCLLCANRDTSFCLLFVPLPVVLLKHVLNAKLKFVQQGCQNEGSLEGGC